MKRISAAVSVFLCAVLLSGCTLSGLSDAIKNRIESGASELSEELSSAAEDLSEEFSEAVSDISEEVSSASEELSQALSSDAETTTETESESETETETEPEPVKAEKPVVLHLLKAETARSTNEYAGDSYIRTLCNARMEELIMERDDMESSLPELFEYLERSRLGRLDEFNSVYEDLMGAAGNSTSAHSSYTSLVTLGRTDSAVFSFASQNEYFYAGAARPWRETAVTNIHSETGKELKLSELVQDIGGVVERLREGMLQFVSERTDAEDASNEIDYFFEDINPEDMPFTAGYDRLSFWFNAGDVFPGAFSDFRIDVLFEGNEELFTDLALNIPEKYMLELPLGTGETYPLHDGRKLLVEPSWTDEERYWFSGLNISIDGESITLDCSGDGIEGSWLVHSDEYGEFLYIVCSDYNGYGRTEIIDINGSSPAAVGEIPEKIASSIVYERDGEKEEITGYTTTQVMTDPERFYMGTPIHLLSSYYGIRSYETGEDGMPIPTAYWYEADGTRTLTLLQDLEVEEMDLDSDEAVGTIVLKKGDEITIRRSHEKDKKVEFWTNDGRMILIEVDPDSKHPGTVNGISAEELFDGMMFAG